MFDDDEDYDNKANVRELPLFKKGEEIQYVVHLLTELMPEDNKLLLKKGTKPGELSVSAAILQAV
jgi:hypothetical protein